MVNNELYHYGVLGMKWGVRRSQKTKRSLTSSGNKNAAENNKKQLIKRVVKTSKRKNTVSEDYERAHKKTEVKYMSDKELRETNNRLQMERQYKQLTQRETSAGRKFVTGVIVASATAVATKYVTKHMDSGVQWVAKTLAK